MLSKVIKISDSTADCDSYWMQSEVTQSCLTLCDPMDHSLPGSSIHGIFQARILEWVAISFSRRSSQPGDWTQVSHIVGRCFTVWATRKVECNSHLKGPAVFCCERGGSLGLCRGLLSREDGWTQAALTQWEACYNSGMNRCCGSKGEGMKNQLIQMRAVKQWGSYPRGCHEGGLRCGKKSKTSFSRWFRPWLSNPVKLKSRV